MASVGEQRVARVVQLVADLSGERLRTARVLDLGGADGGFGLALARQGAREVVGIEGRAANLAAAIAARDTQGLGQVALIHGDARALSRERHGEFDVVLCLGLLYHLDGPEVIEMAERLASVCRGYAVIETQVGLSRRATVHHGGRRHSGIWYAEDVAQPGASLDNPRSFWPTRASLLNLLADAGFTSVVEVLNPVVPKLAAYRDHTLLVAMKGTPVAEGPAQRWPEVVLRLAHPAQGLRYVVRDRLARLRGGGLPSLFE